MSKTVLYKVYNLDNILIKFGALDLTIPLNKYRSRLIKCIPQFYDIDWKINVTGWYRLFELCIHYYGWIIVSDLNRISRKYFCLLFIRIIMYSNLNVNEIVMLTIRVFIYVIWLQSTINIANSKKIILNFY